ncbi:kelch-like protein 23 isoform X2 [Lethenteron reissneri]|uniref:kelch-like protein 23 isoform X2 n=1 Tax=Lethenteron reissneri TaxID=7753 RepID=UPI002AB6F64E|nr:kelch-like protein 23 isoform X2 [Lethenteron reissneri]
MSSSEEVDEEVTLNEQEEEDEGEEEEEEVPTTPPRRLDPAMPSRGPGDPVPRGGPEPERGGYAYAYTCAQHPRELLRALHSFYQHGLFSDITLECHGQQQSPPRLPSPPHHPSPPSPPSPMTATRRSFRCHRAVLSACSAYFHAMFTADMRERRFSRVVLPAVEPDVMETLLRFAYTSRVSITERNVQSLLAAADLLQFGAVKAACERFLVRRLDPSNCLGLLAFAETHACRRLERESRRLSASAFQEVCAGDEFPELEARRLRALLSRRDLEVASEEALLGALAAWVAHDPGSRAALLPELLEIGVNLRLLDTALEEALATAAAGAASTTEALRSALRAAVLGPCPRVERACSAELYVVGGYHWRPLAEVHAWRPGQDAWSAGAALPERALESYAVAALGARVFVSGGYRGERVEEALASLWVYSCERDRWTPGSPMGLPRYCHCAASALGCVFAMGGFRDGAPARDAERYDPLKREWTPIASMEHGVGNATACSFRDCIYVIGGHSGCPGGSSLGHVQAHHAERNQWSSLTLCPHPEYGLCSAVLGGLIYVLGGHSAHVDVYDPERGEWRPGGVTVERRLEGGCAALGGRLLITGGYSAERGAYLQSVEAYDPRSGVWALAGALPGPMRSHGCVVIHGV